MKYTIPLLATVERLCFRVTALVTSRLLSRDLRASVTRLQGLPKRRSYAEAAVVLGGLLGLALIAASFGWPGLLIYFVMIVMLFR